MGRTEDAAIDFHLFFVKNVLTRFQRAGDFHLVQSRTTLLVLSAMARPQVFLFLPEEAVSENRFVAVLGEIHVHSCGIIIVRHGGHVHGDFFCFLFTRFAVSLSSSNLFFSSFDASFDPLFCVSRGFVHKGLDSARSL